MSDELKKLIEGYPDLTECGPSIKQAMALMESTYRGGGKILVCGNGGSASDSEHIVGELMKGFMSKRRLPDSEREKLQSLFGKQQGSYLADHLQGALPAISLVSQSALMTAFDNDVAADMVFAQQVYGYGRRGDTMIGLSTSGNSGNVIRALQVAKALGMHTVGLTGQHGGAMKQLCDATICVPSERTPDIQERHLPIYHTLCIMLEQTFFNETEFYRV